MSKLHGGMDESTAAGDEGQPGVTGRRCAWQPGHLPRMPREASDDQADWVTGWFHERLLAGLSEDQAEDHVNPEHGASREQHIGSCEFLPR